MGHLKSLSNKDQLLQDHDSEHIQRVESSAPLSHKATMQQLIT